MGGVLFCEPEMNQRSGSNIYLRYAEVCTSSTAELQDMSHSL